MDFAFGTVFKLKTLTQLDRSFGRLIRRLIALFVGVILTFSSFSRANLLYLVQLIWQICLVNVNVFRFGCKFNDNDFHFSWWMIFEVKPESRLIGIGL